MKKEDGIQNSYFVEALRTQQSQMKGKCMGRCINRLSLTPNRQARWIGQNDVILNKLVFIFKRYLEILITKIVTRSKSDRNVTIFSQG